MKRYGAGDVVDNAKEAAACGHDMRFLVSLFAVQRRSFQKSGRLQTPRARASPIE